MHSSFREAGVEDWQALVARNDVDAVYITTPTVAKEEIALGAVAASKHILVEKPFITSASVKMSEAAAINGLLFMDATHFVRNPRYHAIRGVLDDEAGSPLSLAIAFYFPFEDTKSNIRFNPSLEPTGALGDMAWYLLSFFRATAKFSLMENCIESSFGTTIQAFWSALVPQSLVTDSSIGTHVPTEPSRFPGRPVSLVHTASAGPDHRSVSMNSVAPEFALVAV